MAIEYLLVTYPEQRAILLHQHPCFQRLLMDMDIKAEFVDPVFAKTGCRQAAD